MKHYIASIIIALCALFNIVMFVAKGTVLNGWVAIAILCMLLFTLRLNNLTRDSVTRLKEIESILR